jgi:hypothetical protein
MNACLACSAALTEFALFLVSMQLSFSVNQSVDQEVSLAVKAWLAAPPLGSLVL